MQGVQVKDVIAHFGGVLPEGLHIEAIGADTCRSLASFQRDNGRSDFPSKTGQISRRTRCSTVSPPRDCVVGRTGNDDPIFPLYLL